MMHSVAEYAASLCCCAKNTFENNESIVLIGTLVGAALLLLGAVLYSYAGIQPMTFYTLFVAGVTILGGSTLFGVIVFRPTIEKRPNQSYLS